LEEIAPPARIPLKDRKLVAVMTGGMTMKTRKTFIAAAIVAVLSCSAAHAQVLGGAVGGAANGALGGGLGNSSVFGGGNAAGSFGGEVDTGSMIHRTRSVADQTSQRARNVGANARSRTESTVATARNTSANAATSAAAAAQTAKGEQMNHATNVAGATASQLDATSFATSTEGAASHSSVIESPVEPQPQQTPKGLDVPKFDSVATDANGSASGNASASRRSVAADVAADGNAGASFDSKKDDTQE
jgi:hypothetical protein